MKKLILIFGIILLCGCENVIDKGIDVSNNTIYGLAKNSIYKYVEGIKVAYSDYQYSIMLGEYSVSDGVTVIVDGNPIELDINYTGDEVNCDGVFINSGKVSLDNCSIYGFSFDYTNGDIIDRD